jgi:hypothetical protein
MAHRHAGTAGSGSSTFQLSENTSPVRTSAARLRALGREVQRAELIVVAEDLHAVPGGASVRASSSRYVGRRAGSIAGHSTHDAASGRDGNGHRPGRRADGARIDRQVEPFERPAQS